jgi:L-ascorbate metabolism protein UlaG (beta-lactamase superfamily)
MWFVGHATVLLQIGQYNFLTDPVWAERCSPFKYAGPKRVRAQVLLSKICHPLMRYY